MSCGVTVCGVTSCHVMQVCDTQTCGVTLCGVRSCDVMQVCDTQTCMCDVMRTHRHVHVAAYWHVTWMWQDISM